MRAGCAAAAGDPGAPPTRYSPSSSWASPGRAPATRAASGCRSAGRRVGSQPRPGGARISVRARSPTNASPPGSRCRPTAEAECALELGGHRGRVSDEAELREADQLRRREVAAPAGLGHAAVADQLDDAARGIVEVAGARVPRREVERIAEQLDASARPRERRVEAVARDEQGEVVERRAGRRLEARSASRRPRRRRPRPAARARPRRSPPSPSERPASRRRSSASSETRMVGR